MSRGYYRHKEALSRCYDLLVAAADAGAPAPTSDDLSAAVGANCLSSAVWLVQKLEKRGLIVVKRYQRARVITIVDTGKSTAEPPKRSRIPHWRASGRKGKPRPVSQEPFVDAPISRGLMCFLYDRPCRFCGAGHYGSPCADRLADARQPAPPRQRRPWERPEPPPLDEHEKAFVGFLEERRAAFA